MKKGQKWSKNGQKSSKMAKNGQKWPKMAKNGQKPQKCPKMPKNGQNVPNWGPKRTGFCSRLYGKSRFGNGSIIYLRRPPYPPKMAKKVTFFDILGGMGCCNYDVMTLLYNDDG
jgi:hypothetical protein